VLHRRHLRKRQKGGLQVGPTKRGKGSKIMAICDSGSLPIAIAIASGSPAEVKLAESTLAARITESVPERLIADKAYDSNALRIRMRDAGIDFIAPHRAGRVSKPLQDGRKLRRYKHRWKIERLNAWLQNSRRLVTRYEYHPENFLGFVHLACMRILLRRRF